MKLISLSLYRCFRGALKHPKKVLLLFVLLTLVLGASVSKMRFLLSTDDLMGEGIPGSDRQMDLKKKYPEGPSSLLILAPAFTRGALTASELCLLRKWYSHERIMNENLISVQSPFDLRRTSAPEDQKHLIYPLLFELDCDHLDQTQATLSQKWKQVVESPWGFLMTDRSARDFSIRFTFRETPNDRFGNFNPKAVQELRTRFEQEVLPALKSVKVHWVGTADYQFATQIGLQASSRLNLVMLLFLWIALRFAFGTWRAGFFFNLSLVTVAAWIYGAKGLFGSPFDVLSNSIFLMLGISMLEDFVFILADQLENASSWRRSFRRLILPSFYTSLTTMIGFLSLCTSPLGVIDRLGLWSAVGAMAEWIMLFFVLPCALMVFGSGQKLWEKKPWVNRERAWLLRWVKRWPKKNISPWLARLSLVVYPLAVFGSFHLNVNDSSHLLFQKTNAIRQGLDHLLESRNWLGSVSLVFSKELEADQKNLMLDQFFKKSLVKRVVSGVESSTSQLAYLTEGQAPARIRLIQLDYEESKVHERLISSDGEERLILYLNQTDAETLMNLQAELRSVCAQKECNLVGSLVSYAEFSSLIPKTLLESMLLSLLLVTLVIAVLAFSLKQQKHLWAILLSSFWGPVLMLALEGVFRLKVNFLTCIFASVLVGLTGDNAIQYLFGSKHRSLEEGITKRGTASILTSALMASASFVFLGSYFDPPKKFGVLLAGGLLAALIGDLWILKGLKRNA